MWDDGSFDSYRYCQNNSNCKYKFRDEDNILKFHIDNNYFRWYKDFLELGNKEDATRIKIDQPNIYFNKDSFIELIQKINLNLGLM